MAFKIVSGTPQLVWCPVDYSTGGVTLYVGQLVQSTGDGVGPLGVASGAFDTTSDKTIFGVVVGTNRRVPQFDATNKAEYITSVSSIATQAARDFFGPEGGWGKSEPQAMVQVAVIDPCTVLQADLFKGAVGTAPAIVSTTAASATGAAVTFAGGGADAAAVADMNTVYFVKGANQGRYRIRTDATASAGTVAVCFPAAIAAGDTFKSVNVRPRGLSRVQTDSLSLYLDTTAAVTSDYYGINVLRLDLSVAGKENVVFMFNAAHFVAK